MHDGPGPVRRHPIFAVTIICYPSASSERVHIEVLRTQGRREPLSVRWNDCTLPIDERVLDEVGEVASFAFGESLSLTYGIQGELF